MFLILFILFDTLRKMKNIKAGAILIFLFAVWIISINPLFSQDLYDYSAYANDDDFYNPTEYISDTSTSVYDGDSTNYQDGEDMSDEYHPDGYYEPYDFNMVNSVDSDNSSGNQENNYTTYYDPQNYDEDTYIPEASEPSYEEPLQMEINQTSKKKVKIDNPVENNQIISGSDKKTESSLLPSKKRPIKVLVDSFHPKRYIVANLNLEKALKNALISSDEDSWKILNKKLIKLYADLNSKEPSYPEIYEEFERINSVLINFTFSGGFGARNGMILKWNDRYISVVGPLSPDIKIRRVKKEKLVYKLTEVLGGKVRKKLSNNTYYIILNTLIHSVNSIMNDVELSNYEKLKVISEGLKLGNKRLKKMIKPYFNLLKLKFISEFGKNKNPNFKRALRYLKI